MTHEWRDESLFGTDRLNKDTELAKQTGWEQITFTSTKYVLKNPITSVC